MPCRRAKRLFLDEIHLPTKLRREAGQTVTPRQPRHWMNLRGLLPNRTEVRAAEKFGNSVPCGIQLNCTATGVNKRRSSQKRIWPCFESGACFTQQNQHHPKGGSGGIPEVLRRTLDDPLERRLGDKSPHALAWSSYAGVLDEDINRYARSSSPASQSMKTSDSGNNRT
jgi:hypothetical protein